MAYLVGMNRFYGLLIAVLLPFLGWSQTPPIINNISPTPNTVGVPSWTDIIIDFDTTLSVVSVTQENVKVFGRWSGPIDGGLGTLNSNQSIRFTPNEPYMAGEYITVMISTGIKSYPQLGGVNLPEGYAFSFWATAGPGPLQLYPIDTIPVRNSGEGWIQSYGAYAGDLNNDGFSDMAVINENSDDMRVFLNDGLGFYSAFDTYQVKGGNRPSPSEGGDFNGDGEIDIVIGNVGNNIATVWYGDGAGDLVTDSAYTSGEAVRAVGVIDLNGDAWGDIVTANRSGSNIGLLTNDGTGGFQNSTTLDPGGLGEHGLCVADLNNDGLQDIIVGCHESEELIVVMNNGSGGLAPQAPIPAHGKPWMLAAGDMNGDGFVDIASANSDSNVVLVIFGDGTGQLTNPMVYPTGNFPLAVDLGDLDGDGDLDLVTSNYSGIDYTFYENDGAGNLINPITYGALGAGSCAIFHDRNQDGDLDITFIDEVDDVIIPYDDDSTIAFWSVPELAESSLSVSVFPNPSDDLFHFEWNANTFDDAQFEVFTMDGRLISKQVHQASQSALQTFTWTAEQLPSGSYWYRLRQGARSSVGSLILLPR